MGGVGAPSESRFRAHLYRLAIPPAVGGLLLMMLGRPAAGVLALALCPILATASAFHPALPVAAGEWRGRSIRRLGHGLSALANGLLFVVCFIPVWALGRVHRPWIGRRRPGWTEVADRPVQPRDPYGALATPSSTHPRGPLRTSFAVVGVVVVFAMLDATAGVAWEHAFPGRPSGPVRQVTDAIGGGDPTVHDKRTDTPAMRDETWGNAYFQEMREIRYDYWPYLLNRPRPFAGKYINLDGWERRTWTPDGSSKGRPVVWFFGGSAAWGEGQRDDHTIESAVSHLADADGLPITAMNFGQSGWVAHQEVGLFDQLLTTPGQPRPDLVAFYDGANDVSVQAQVLPGGGSGADAAVPSHFGIDNAVALSGGAPTAASEPSTEPTTGNALSELWTAYRDHSLAAKAMRGAHGLLAAQPAGAETPCDQACRTANDIPEIGQEAVDRAVLAYHEDRAAAMALGHRFHVDVQFFWQPEAFDLPGYRQAPNRLGAPTIDLTGVLDDHREMFLDLVHTNEPAAAIVAQTIYQHLRPDLVTWYQEHGR